MNEALIAPFIRATINVFETMLDTEARATKVEIAKGFRHEHDVTGVIGLSGESSGTVVISLEESVALGATKAMLCEEATVIDDAVMDVVGELTNMIAGSAKATLVGYDLRLALPSVITGSQHSIRFASTVRPAVVFFECEWGKFSLEVALSELPNNSDRQAELVGAATCPA